MTKTGTSEVTLGGGVDISGNLDVQNGKVAFTNGQVRGHVRARTGTSLIVGGTGFNEQGPVDPAPEIVTTGLSLALRRGLGHQRRCVVDRGGRQWEQLQLRRQRDTRLLISDPAFPGITKAYNIPDVG